VPKLDFSGYFACIKKHWLLFAVTLVVVVVFFSGAILAVYRKVRTAVPGAANVLPAK
jgi:hypothetical protein